MHFLSLIDLPLLLKNITLAKAAEVLNILDYDQYLKIVDLAKENNIPGILTAFNDIVKKVLTHIYLLVDWEVISVI